jgi:hypothetical protein
MTFAGRTLDQYIEIVQPSLDARAELEALENQRQAIIARRDAADAVSNQAWKLLVHGVKAEPTQGEDGAMYAAMGFTRESLRDKGLTRRRKANGNGTEEVTKTGSS